MSADSSQNQFELKFAELRGTLACPACEGELRLETDRVVCARCGRAYPIVDGIPVLIAGRDEAVRAID
jgi:uncharacterized protein YbaR (Trm112 family)